MRRFKVPKISGLHRKRLSLSFLVLAGFVIFQIVFTVFEVPFTVLNLSGWSNDASAPEGGIPWEFLILKPNAKVELWNAFERVGLDERERALVVVVRIIDQLSPAQADELVAGLAERSLRLENGRRTREHLGRLLEVLELIGLKHKETVHTIGNFLAQVLGRDWGPAGAELVLQVEAAAQTFQAKYGKTPFR